MSFNSIPNIDKGNNKFNIGIHEIEIPEGSYEISDIEEYIMKEVHDIGFENKQLSANKKHISDYPINISKVNSIGVECNLIIDSYSNDTKGHLLHMFFPNVPSGYRIVEKVSNVIYLPINTRYIDEIIFKIVDQDGNLVNFNKEVVTIRLHLKELK